MNYKFYSKYLYNVALLILASLMPFNFSVEANQKLLKPELESTYTINSLSRQNKANRYNFNFLSKNFLPDDKFKGYWPTLTNFFAQEPYEAFLAFLEGPGITLDGNQVIKGQSIRSPVGARRVLHVPGNSGANIRFKAASSSIISGYLVSAGYTNRNTEYWYPCNGHYGRFVIGWSEGGSTPTCSQVRLWKKNEFGISNYLQDRHLLALLKGNQTDSPFSFPKINQLISSFPDTQGHWAESEIDILNERNIIDGYQDGTFRPNANITRAEFSAIVNKAFGNRPTIRSVRGFSDIKSDFWARDAIDKAYALGFVSGYPDETFLPSKNISRTEAIVSLANGLMFDGTCNRNSLENVYRDATKIPDWACKSINAATVNGIRIQGPEANLFKPSQEATRADIAMFVYNALQQVSEDIILQPTGSKATWVWADVTDERLEVNVLGGAILIGPEISTMQKLVAGDQYTIEKNQAGIYKVNVKSLSSERLKEIANSPEVKNFLDNNNWPQETIPQIKLYETYRNALYQPDLRISSLQFNLINRNSSTKLLQVTGTIENIGGSFISNELDIKLSVNVTTAGNFSFSNNSPTQTQGIPSTDLEGMVKIDSGESVTAVFNAEKVPSELYEEFINNGILYYRSVLAYPEDVGRDGNLGNDDSNIQNNEINGSLKFSELLNGPITVP